MLEPSERVQGDPSHGTSHAVVNRAECGGGATSKVPDSDYQRRFFYLFFGRFSMKSLLLAGTAIVAFVTAASAADLAARPYTKAPAAPARTHNWTGCYAGGHVGAGC